MAAHNKQFAIDAEQEGSAFVADAMGPGGKPVRSGGSDGGQRQHGKVAAADLQLPPSRLRVHFVKAAVRVHEYPDGQLAVYWGPHRLADYGMDGVLVQPASGLVAGTTPSEAVTRRISQLNPIAFRYVTLCRARHPWICGHRVIAVGSLKPLIVPRSGRCRSAVHTWEVPDGPICWFGRFAKADVDLCG